MRCGLVTAAVLVLGAAQHVQAQDTYIPERVATAVQQMQAPLVSTIKVSRVLEWRVPKQHSELTASQ
jgi:hypothetical protein